MNNCLIIKIKKCYKINNNETAKEKRGSREDN